MQSTLRMSFVLSCLRVGGSGGGFLAGGSARRGVSACGGDEGRER